jgi:hypothetical protein
VFVETAALNGKAGNRPHHHDEGGAIEVAEVLERGSLGTRPLCPAFLVKVKPCPFRLSGSSWRRLQIF